MKQVRDWYLLLCSPKNTATCCKAVLNLYLVLFYCLKITAGFLDEKSELTKKKKKNLESIPFEFDERLRRLLFCVCTEMDWAFATSFFFFPTFNSKSSGGKKVWTLSLRRISFVRCGRRLNLWMQRGSQPQTVTLPWRDKEGQKWKCTWGESVTSVYFGFALVHLLSLISLPVTGGLINGEKHSSDGGGKIWPAHYLRRLPLVLENCLTQSVSNSSPAETHTCISATGMTLMPTIQLLFHWLWLQAAPASSTFLSSVI